MGERLGIGKRTVNARMESASAAIGEKIDLVHDTPEELERKVAKRQAVEPKVDRPKRRKPAPRDGIEAPTQPAKLHAGEVGSRIEDVWEAFDAVSWADQRRFIHDACRHHGLDPLKMAPLDEFGLADEDAERALDLPPEVASATGDAAVDAQPEQPDAAADAEAEEADDAAVDAQMEQADEPALAQAEQGGDTAVAQAEQPDAVADAEPEEQDDADLGAENLQDTDDDVPEGADQEPGGATKCAYCNQDLYDGDQRQVINGRLYHGFCVENGKRLAIAAE